MNPRAVDRAKRLIGSRQYVLRSKWGDVQPGADEENAYLKSHTWEEYGEWHLGLTEGATDETKARYAFVFGVFRRLHRSGLRSGTSMPIRGGSRRRPRFDRLWTTALGARPL